jgi:quinol-cytochrome oxidoreductase complex cytochrome b subunit
VQVLSWGKRLILNPIYWPSAASLASFIVLIISGIALGFWYEPHPSVAYESIKYIGDYVAFGQLMLSIHHYATDVLIASTLLHLIRVFFMGTYKGKLYTWADGSYLISRLQRNHAEVTELKLGNAWISGVVLLLITVLFLFSGYLLRWDEIGYYSIQITTSIVAYTPFIGDTIRSLILGGTEITSRSLARFYIAHAVLLPLLYLLFLGLHYYYIKKARFYWLEVGVGSITLGFLLLVSVLSPFELAAKPSAELTVSLKPPWLFLWLYVIERGVGYISPHLNFVNILLLLSILALLFLVPYIDSGEENPQTKRKRTIVGIASLTFFILLSIIGYLWEPPSP